MDIFKYISPSQLIDIRQQAKKNKNYELSDQIRDYLDSIGIIIMDCPDGSYLESFGNGLTREYVISKMKKT